MSENIKNKKKEEQSEAGAANSFVADEKVLYSLDYSALCEKFSVNPSKGLSEPEIAKRMEKYGENKLEEEKSDPLWKKFLNQFADFTVIILIIAAIISGVVSELSDALIIIAIVIVNAILGVAQEGKAEKAIAALKDMAAPEARVLRGGKQLKVKAEQLVPGDVVLLEAGNIVPADIRLGESQNLKVEEAVLTGESVPVEKDALFLPKEGEKLGLGDRHNMLYASTSVSYGRGQGIVVSTAYDTAVGKIASGLNAIKKELTPLQESLNQLGKVLGIVCLAVCALVFFVGLLEGGEVLSLFMTSVSLAVAAIPEGLPAVVTIVLALGMNRMAKKNAIVKRLMAVETLGSIDRICSDKTGTLTQNEMTVTGVYAGESYFEVEGGGYNPSGTMRDKEGKELKYGDLPVLDRLFQIASICNDAELSEKNGDYGVIGDPTEGALLTAAAKYGVERAPLQAKLRHLGEIPFDSSRKMMTVFYSGFSDLEQPKRHPDNAAEHDGAKLLSLTKGAPDIIVSRCEYCMTEDGLIRPFTAADKVRVMVANKELAAKALRVLAHAFKSYDSEKVLDEKETLEAGASSESAMVFVGLTGMIDPPREEAKAAIAECRRAGIKPIMITGDYSETAAAIAHKLDLMREGDTVIQGSELEEMDEKALCEASRTAAVYARVSPEHKVRIVEALRADGHICSMTGDGVNDAPALKQADIGVAMGITGSEVAKSSADMILTDDNFATIVNAVHEGRVIYSNIRKFVGFLLSCNVGEILIIFLTNLILGPGYTPLLPIQLLWLNLVTDSFPALALGREAGEKDIMNYPPRKREDKIIDKEMIWSIVTQACAIFVAVFAAFQIGRYIYPDVMMDAAGNIAKTVSSYNFFGFDGFEPSAGARTFAFVTLITAELLRAFACRSEKHSVFSLGLFSNPTMNKSILLSFALMFVVVFVPALDALFHTINPSLIDWLIMIALAFVPFVAGEIFKYFYHRKEAPVE